MKTFTLTILLLLFSFNILLFGQNNNNDIVNNATPKYKYSLGMGAGFSTGFGASFRFVPNRFGVQVNLAPIYILISDETLISSGLTFLFNIIEADKTNFYLYQGNHYCYHSYSNYVYYKSTGNFNDVYFPKIKKQFLNNSIGLGIQLIVSKRVGIDIMGGYGFYNNFQWHDFTGEAGIYYKF